MDEDIFCLQTLFSSLSLRLCIYCVVTNCKQGELVELLSIKNGSPHNYCADDRSTNFSLPHNYCAEHFFELGVKTTLDLWVCTTIIRSQTNSRADTVFLSL